MPSAIAPKGFLLVAGVLACLPALALAAYNAGQGAGFRVKTPFIEKSSAFS